MAKTVSRLTGDWGRKPGDRRIHYFYTPAPGTPEDRRAMRPPACKFWLVWADCEPILGLMSDDSNLCPACRARWPY